MRLKKEKGKKEITHAKLVDQRLMINLSMDTLRV